MNETDTNYDIIVRLPYKANYFVVEKEFIIYFDVNGVTQKFNILPGEITDFASIPKFLHWWLSPTDPTIAIPSLIHDFLCDRPAICSRKEADRILFQKCISFGMNPVKAYFVYIGVRIGASRIYKFFTQSK